ncbi:MAG: hypothetical protein ACR2NE_04460, partial [Pirellulales bacterium]
MVELSKLQRLDDIHNPTQVPRIGGLRNLGAELATDFEPPTNSTNWVVRRLCPILRATRAGAEARSPESSAEMDGRRELSA